LPVNGEYCSQPNNRTTYVYVIHEPDSVLHHTKTKECMVTHNDINTTMNLRIEFQKINNKLEEKKNIYTYI